MSVSGPAPAAGTAERYRAFAAEARGRSPQYEELTIAVAGDPLILGFLDALPGAKRQPNLLFAAACYLLGGPADLRALRGLINDRGGELARTMLTRRTQTNEPARCATLLPDRYSYDYDGRRLTGTDPDAPVLRCRPLGPVPIPARVPEVAWRAGLDLNPLDVTDDADVRWLECLIWPGETGRRERLAAAIETARSDPPPVHRGDLLTDLPALARQAPPGPTLVVYHSAVLAYVAPEQRSRFAETVAGLNAAWLSNEGPDVLPGVAAPKRHGDNFALVRDGTAAIALTDPHGTWIEWLPGSADAD